MSGIDEQQRFEENHSDFPLCRYCASRRYKRDWRDLGSATMEVEDDELLASYNESVDFEWNSVWRCIECGEEPNEGDQQTLRNIFMEHSDE